ncbi:MFS transporter [Bacillus sp. FJAT-42376]|uniref:MFS transporter n=1 Tax=Bacillus sp. FJAT-42376 TaxID=2014076 RepID=UPI000F4DF093|nr:MFS transporter [Bacillus sp. FJAT-42376]AZB44818.1 MFS transporter [Bacillus sp. FJAT-42376]
MSEIQHTETKSLKLKTALPLFFSLPVFSWALYDFANTIFSSNMITIFFPFYLEEAIGSSEKMDQIASTFLSYANAAAGLFLVLFSPLFGVQIDRSGKKKAYIIRFTAVTVLCTLLMGVFGSAAIPGTLFGLPASMGIVVILFIIAKFFYSSSLIFYDAMITDVSNAKSLPLISGFGVAVGYVGTLAGLSIYPFIGGRDFHHAFIPTAILFALFTLPLLFFTHDQPIERKGPKKHFMSGYKEIIATFKDLKQYKPAFLFMIAYFFINDALATAIAMMAIYAKAIVGFSNSQFILLYLVSTITSIGGSFLFGFITKAAGAKKSVMMVGFVLLGALLIAVAATEQWMFWIAGSLFGISLGAIWVTSRTLIVELTPEEKRGQFFGLFAFSGKVSSVIGPFIYGTITLLLSDYGDLASRAALGSLLIMTAAGLAVHQRVRYTKPS